MVGNHELSRTRLRELRAMACRVGEQKARELYRELYGAEVAASIPEARVRESIIEACDELLEEKKEDLRPEKWM